MYLQVKGLNAWCLNLHSEASVLDHDHFLLIGVVTGVRIGAALLLGLGLLGLVVSSITIHYCCSCTVRCGEQQGSDHGGNETHYI